MNVTSFTYISKKQLINIFFAIYVILSLPVVVIFLKSGYVRYICYQTVSYWRSHLCPPEYIFCGDSLTEGGQAFGLKIGAALFSDLNFGTGGFCVSQIKEEVRQAIKMHPKYIFITAGTNDILSERENLDKIEKDYDEMLELFSGSKCIPIVTLVPYVSNDKYSNNLKKLNSKIKSGCENLKIKIIDLNPEIAPQNKLLSIYTIDGVHLSSAAYKIWAKKMRAVLKDIT